MGRILPRVPDGSSLDPPPGNQVPAEVALIGYQDQGNLGMGYLAAVLQQRGHIVQMMDVRDGPESLAARLSPSPGAAATATGARRHLGYYRNHVFHCFAPAAIALRDPAGADSMVCCVNIVILCLVN